MLYRRSCSSSGFHLSDANFRRLGACLRSLALAALLTAPVLASLSARAGITLFTDPDVGGFVDDSANEAFLDAIDHDPTEYISFSTDSDGAPTPEDGAVNGGIFSELVALSSPEASGISAPENVLVAGGGSAEAQVGPTPGFTGSLEISFDAPVEVTAIGLGPIAFGLADIITVYDPDDLVLFTGGGVSNNQYTFIGFTTDDGDLIGRVVLEGEVGQPLEDQPFSIQDLQFVPEPGATAQAAAAWAALLLWRSRRRALCG